MTNEPTPEEIEKQILLVINKRPWNVPICEAVAEWHLQQIYQLTKERDELQAQVYTLRNQDQ